VPVIAGGYDAELRRHNAVLRRAAGVRAGDRVLDVGCGAGQTTREAARAAGDGVALGVDVSAAAIARARALAEAEGVGNAVFEVADAGTHGFAPASFDLAISRFGTMFFGDPGRAFANVGRALRPGGRLVMLVWQAAERNEWDVVISGSLAGPGQAPVGLDPFSLADPPTVTAILGAAGFAEVGFADVHEPVHYGADVDAALDWIRGFTCTRQALQRLDPAGASAALERLRAELAARLTGDGIWFDARAWLVTARRGAPA
jgi:SAM-dependent methyltransferase